MRPGRPAQRRGSGRGEVPGLPRQVRGTGDPMRASWTGTLTLGHRSHFQRPVERREGAEGRVRKSPCRSQPGIRSRETL